MSTRAYQHFGKLDEGRRSTDFGEACSRISRDVWRTNTVWPELVEALNDCAVPVFVCTGRLWVGDVSASDRNRMAETRRAKRVGGRGSVRSTRAGRRQRRRVPEKITASIMRGPRPAACSSFPNRFPPSVLHRERERAIAADRITFCVSVLRALTARGFVEGLLTARHGTLLRS